MPKKPESETKVAPATETQPAVGGPLEIKESQVPDIGALVDHIVYQALINRASDIHIEPSLDSVIIRYRIDGMLREVFKLAKSLESVLIFKIKILSRLRTDEHFAPQDGKIEFAFQDGKKVDTRVSIIPITHGEKTVMRLLSQDERNLTLKDLGLTGRDLEIMERSYMKPQGMILAVGPTGSGKTTTLYVILKTINSREKNITTIEDPVEYNIDGVNHIQINPKADLTFATGLRSILRQDPNVIMVGEIRDTETAKIAINASMTGHMVLSTLHTNDAITTIPRLIDMGVEPFLVASTVNVVVSQRLCRLLCPECKQQVSISAAEHEELTRMRKDIAKLVKSGEKVYKAGTCTACGGSGYKGRIGLYEVVEVNEAMRRIITSGASVDDLFAAARENGLTLVVEDGVKKLKEGLIDLPELVRVTALKE